MQCPACGYPEMESKNQDETLCYGGQSVTVTNLRGEFCPACGEGVWDSESNRRLDEEQTALITAARAKVSANIRRIRKSLKLTQSELAKNFGLGPLAFSRYERGKTQPPLLLVKVLSLLEKHPGLLDELREMDVPDSDAPNSAGNSSRRKGVSV